MIESVTYSEYNIKIYNLINIINIAELDIFKYFHNNNIIINFKSRDCKRLITHFIINNILKYIKNPGAEKIILNYNNLQLQILDSCHLNDIDIIINKVLRKFKICYINYNNINNLQTTDLLDIKRNLQRCDITTNKIYTIKKFLKEGGFYQLTKSIDIDQHLRMSLAK